MRIATFLSDEGPEIAFAKHGVFVPVKRARAMTGLGPGPGTMLELIDAGPAAWAEAHSVYEVLAADAARSEAISRPRLLAPIPRLRKNVFCIGRNYEDHATEQGAEVPAHPVFFTKAPTTVLADGGTVPFPPGVLELDYEGELAVVIGVGGSDLARERALDHVFGFTLVNDITARDAQRRHLQWFKGKSFDGTCPMGPIIVSKEEIADLGTLRVRTYVNDDLRQDQPVSDMIFDVPTIIERLSAGMTLEPGDVIATGTPSGVGAPTGAFLVPGDVVRVVVEEIGELVNRIGEPKVQVRDATLAAAATAP